MKYKLLLLLVCASVYVQAQQLCHTDIMNEEVLNPADSTMQFIKYNFSDLWLKTENEVVYGVIGVEHQRIRVKILTVKKNPANPKEYLVKGRSEVNGNVCDFTGKITVENIRSSKRTGFGVDDEFKGLSKTQGLLTAKYTFAEDQHQSHTGIFRGTVQTKWYLNQQDQPVYDDINSAADGYFNNAFTGTWKMYGSKVSRKCNWGDYRVPYSNCDFDIGTGEFNVAEKYVKYGWSDFALKNKAQSLDITVAKGAGVKKPWWQ